jgi:hypothetical protein
MPSLIVQFEGICTHILPPHAPDVAHLVVVPHDERHVPDGQKHVPYLWIRRGNAEQEDIDAFAVQEAGLRYDGIIEGYHRIRLMGVRFQIVNPDGMDAYSLDRTFVCGLPSLTPQAGYLLNLDETIVRGETGLLDALFDVSSGRFSGMLVDTGNPDKGRPAAAILSALTVAEPILRATGIAPGGRIRDLTLRSGSRIWMENVAADEDADDDFVLHYVVVTNPPAKPKIPGEAKCLAVAGSTAPRRGNPRNPRQSLGPGCANSTFP